MRTLRSQAGFTLVEIMIVVAIIGLLASIAIPNLLRTRMNANESAIKKDLRTFSSGNETYRAGQNPPSYAPDVTSLVAPALGPAFLDMTWNTPPKHGFNYVYAVGGAPATTYSVLAAPSDPGLSGTNTYCVDQSGVIVGSTNDGAANVPTGDANGCNGGVAIL